MRQFYWIFALFIAISMVACQESKITIDQPIKTENGQDRDNDNMTGNDYVYHLPVIFHVFYKDSSDTLQYIPQERLAEILSNVNELYQGDVYNRNLDTTASVNIHVQFELAQKDESGKSLTTPGVEYVPYPDAADSIDCNTFMNDRSKKYQKYLWDPNDYINVMVYKFAESSKGETTLGISNMPYKVGDYPQIDGLSKSKTYPMTKDNLSFAYCVSLNSKYLHAKYEGTRYTTDKDSTSYMYSSLDPNATLAHELGHYLGLNHVFAETSSKSKTEPADNEKDTDHCTDTPSYNRKKYTEWYSNFVKEHIKQNKSYTLRDVIVRENSSGKKWNADNFMDYSACLNMRFTPDQAYRMRQVLYYSPLIPGPKVDRTLTRAMRAVTGTIDDLPIVLSEARTAPRTPIVVRIHK